MKKIKCFEREESVSYPGKYIIKPIHDNFYLERTTGSFGIIAARLMGLSYAQYLRMCRDCFGAEIVGKGSIYPVAYFPFSKELLLLIDNLNARANKILWEREHPDYEEHRKIVQNENPIFFKEVTSSEQNNS